MENTIKSNILFKFFKLFTFSIFLYILYTLDFKTLQNEIYKIDLLYIFIAFLFNIPLLFIKSYRWNYILQKQSCHTKLFDTFKYYTASLYIGILTPGRIGEFSKVFYLKQLHNKNYGLLFSSVLIDRLYDLYFLILISICGFYLLNIPIDNLPLYLVVFFVLIPFIIIRTQLLHIIINFFANKLSTNFQENLNSFLTTFKEGILSILKINDIFKAMTITILAYTLFFSQIYLIATSINIPIDFISLSIIIALVNLISLLPISIAGLGTREITLIYFLSPLSISTEQTVVFSLLILVISYIGGGLLGFYSFMKTPLKRTL